jgi:hypothetical protein
MDSNHSHMRDGVENSNCCQGAVQSVAHAASDGLQWLPNDEQC